MKIFKVTIARILTNYPAKVFTVQAPDIISAQIRVWRKVKKWHTVIAAEQCVQADGSKSLAGSPVILDDTLAQDETRMFRRR